MNKKYVFIENIEEVGKETYEMPEDEFLKIFSANAIIFEAYRFEELLAILISNFFEFNKIVLSYADRNRLHMFYIKDYFQKRIDINRAALNFLATLNMYHDFIKKYIKNPEIEKLFNEDKNIQRCLVMRHYIQHVESFPIDTSLSYINGAVDVMLTSIRFSCDPSDLKIDKLGKSTQNKYYAFFSADENVDLYQIINQGMDAICQLQQKIRDNILYTQVYVQAKKFLLDVSKKISNRSEYAIGPYTYYESDVQGGGIKHCSIATDMINFIDENTSLYACNTSFSNSFITTAPDNFLLTCCKEIYFPEVTKKSYGESKKRSEGKKDA